MVESEKDLRARRDRAHRQFMLKKKKHINIIPPHVVNGNVLMSSGTQAQGGPAVATAVISGMPKV